MIGKATFTADFNSYGQPYPLLQDEKVNATKSNATATANLPKFLLFMI
jgi:hypothetical protein